MKEIAALVIAYLTGSVPTGYLVGRFVKGIDIRKHGSGNIGATNVFRVVGKAWGGFVLLADAAKGFLPVLILPRFFGAHFIDEGIFKMLIGLAAISGHNWTIFLKFKGGKGVATTLGVLIGLLPKVAGICFVVWVIVLVITRYISVASLAASLALPISLVILNYPFEYIVLGVILCAVSTYKHKSNIRRLMMAQENRIRLKRFN